MDVPYYDDNLKDEALEDCWVRLIDTLSMRGLNVEILKL